MRAAAADIAPKEPPIERNVEINRTNQPAMRAEGEAGEIRVNPPPEQSATLSTASP
jgi:hypothetical protein